MGKDLVSVSMPVELFEPRSFLERLTDNWSYATTFLNRAAGQLLSYISISPHIPYICPESKPQKNPPRIFFLAIYLCFSLSYSRFIRCADVLVCVCVCVLECRDPLERFKNVITFAISGLHCTCRDAKPFNRWVCCSLLFLPSFKSLIQVLFAFIQRFLVCLDDHRQLVLKFFPRSLSLFFCFV